MKKYLKQSYLLLFIIYAIYSYVLTDPNLTLISFAPFVKFQTFLWQNILPNQVLRSAIYLILTILLFINYFALLKNSKENKVNSEKRLFKYLLLLSLPLLFAYNALSYDVFNYIFNGKILIHYKANPHVRVALDYPNDLWVRFMNNTHTPAPYGYGWTAVSVIPYVLGFGKFISTWFSFKLFSLLGIVITFSVISMIVKKEKVENPSQKMAILFLNPLFLIEFLGNAHNDLWMIWPALLALYYLKYYKNSFMTILFMIVLMTVSVNIKFSTLALLPLIIYLLFEESLKKIKFFTKIYQLIDHYFFDFASLLMFLPLFTSRSRFFLPWYLSWSLIFLPLLKSKLWQELLLVFALSSMLRYLPWIINLPWMSFGLDNSGLINQQILTTWLIPFFYLLIKGAKFLFNRSSEK